jgi:hypothetical protein
MEPENTTANPSPYPNAITGMDSLFHFPNSPSASSRETVMFLLMAQALGDKAARRVAKSFGWEIDSIAPFA